MPKKKCKSTCSKVKLWLNWLQVYLNIGIHRTGPDGDVARKCVRMRSINWFYLHFDDIKTRVKFPSKNELDFLRGFIRDIWNFLSNKKNFMVSKMNLFNSRQFIYETHERLKCAEKKRCRHVLERSRQK